MILPDKVGYACVADGDSGLRIIDISQPSSPIETGYYKTTHSANGITIKGAYLFVSDQLDGVYLCQEGTDLYSGVKDYSYYWGPEIDGTSTDFTVLNGCKPAPVDKPGYCFRLTNCRYN